ncbi:MAG: hypothetical protein M3Q80_02445 [bacterium]|nr:hypothetical protein [bacterium]
MNKLVPFYLDSEVDRFLLEKHLEVKKIIAEDALFGINENDSRAHIKFALLEGKDHFSLYEKKRDLVGSFQRLAINV